MSGPCCWLIKNLAEGRSRNVAPRLRRSTARAWEARWWGMLSVAVQDSLAATLVDDAPHLLHGWHGTRPPLGKTHSDSVPTGMEVGLLPVQTEILRTAKP